MPRAMHPTSANDIGMFFKLMASRDPREVWSSADRKDTGTAKAVTAVVARIDESKDDPYRTTIHFLAGLLTFCLGVIAAVFSALNSGNVDTHQLSYRMLGGVLGSIAFVAWLCTAAVAFIQTKKFRHRAEHKHYLALPVILRAGLMLALTLLGGLAVAYCVRYGYAILACLDEPAGLWDSLMGLLWLAF
jgi:uncharacterized membrane protein YidH (DUF202 family)